MYSHHHPPPYYHKKRSGGGSGCCRCICCCCCFLFLLVLISTSAILIAYLIYDPKPPAYEVSDFRVTSLDMNPESSTVDTSIELTVKADNPNKRIGFVYGADNSINVSFNAVDICSGKVPGFRQGSENTTLVRVDLKGKANFDEGMRKAYDESRTSRRVPLLVKIRVPVNLVVGEVVLREIVAFVDCKIVLDDLAPGRDVKILSKETSVRFEL